MKKSFTVLVLYASDQSHWGLLIIWESFEFFLDSVGLLLWMSCLQLDGFKDLLKQLDNLWLSDKRNSDFVFIGSNTGTLYFVSFHCGCISSSVRTWKLASLQTSSCFKGHGIFYQYVFLWRYFHDEFRVRPLEELGFIWAVFTLEN